MNEITTTNINDVLTEIQEAFFEIPFGNTGFQTDAFVVAAQITPARAYRAVGLEISSKIQAVLEYKYKEAKENIDIEELESKISDPETSEFDRRRHRVDIQYKIECRKFSAKLLRDALAELNILYGHFKALPKLTNEEFEMKEPEYFVEKLQRESRGITGPNEALMNMVNDLNKLTAIEQDTLKLK